MKRQKLFVTILAIVMALLIIVPMLSIIFTAGRASAISQYDIDVLENQQQELKKKQEALQAKIDANKNDRASMVTQKAYLDEQVEITRQKIANLNTQITTYEGLINQKQKEYDAAKAKEELRMQQFKFRLRAMEELGTVSYASILFGADSFSDLLGRLDFASDVMSNDEEVVNSLRQAKAEMATAMKGLEGAKAELEYSRSEKESEVVTLNNQVEQTKTMLSQLNTASQEFNAAYEENAAAEEALAQKILEMAAELARQNSGGNSGATGQYIWPSNCRLITSPFGSDYLNGAWRKHNGVDIGASYGTDIYAADGGEVVSSTYSSSYGNYVMISHGNGRFTLYAHMSERLVSVGDVVGQGQVIGLVGSTGYSFGAHIHFEIIQDGAYQNPLDYLGGYVQYW